MSFDFHPDMWLELLAHHPVFAVVLFGQVGGVSFTQLIKKTYLDLSALPGTPPRVPDGRYRATVRLLSCVSAFAATNILWVLVIPGPHTTGLHWVASVIAGVTSPWLYTALKAAVAWKFQIGRAHV